MVVSDGVDAVPARRPAPPHSGRRVLVAACSANFLGFLGVTVANLALPALARDFPGAGLADLSWVISIYAAAFAALLAPAGRFADGLGRRPVFLVGVGGFVLGSAAAAVSPALPLLFAARAVQAAGGALMVPASLALVLAETAPEKRRSAIGSWGASAAVAAAVGPSIGGLLVDWAGWRSLFLINLLPGVALLYAGWRQQARTAPTRTWPDWLGSVLLAAGTFALLLGVTEGPRWGWTSLPTWAAIGGGLVGLVAAVLRATTQPVPALDVRLWRNAAFALGNLASTFFGVALFAWLLVGVLFLVDVWHFSEIQAGLAMSPGAVMAAAAGMAAGRVRAVAQPRVLVLAGACCFALGGAIMHGALGTTPHYWSTWFPVALIVGAGVGAISVGLSSIAALSVPSRDFAAATGFNAATRQLGGALGIAALSAILATGGAGLARYRSVYVYCAAAAGLVAVTALGLFTTRARSRTS